MSNEFDPFEASIDELQKALDRGEINSIGLVEKFRQRIAEYDAGSPGLNAVLELDETAGDRAAALDSERRTGKLRGPLHGIPFVLKDNFATTHMRTTAGCVALASFVPRKQAHQLTRLLDAGAILLAKTNMHELAAGVTTVSSIAGHTRNPYDLERHAGGSSGGTGSAVAASFAAFGMGSDTCGSIRIPSSACSLFGLRPTKGISSTAGVVPLSQTQDVAGPLARSARDLALVLDATCGADPDDPSTAHVADGERPRFCNALDDRALEGVRLGKLVRYFGARPEELEIASVVERSLCAMQDLGAEIVEVDEIDPDGLSASDLIPFEFARDLARYLEQENAPVDSLERIVLEGWHHHDLAKHFKRRTASGKPAARASYQTACTRRRELIAELSQIMQQGKFDALVYPTIRVPLTRLEDGQPGLTCQLASHTASPAISMPAGYTDERSPVGVEFLGAPLSDAKLLSIAHAYSIRFDIRRPPPTTPPLQSGRAPRPRELRVVPISGASLPAPFDRAWFDPVRQKLSMRSDSRFDRRAWVVCLHESAGIQLEDGRSAALGPVVWNWIPADSADDAVIQLTPRSAELLGSGKLLVVAHSRNDPGHRQLSRLVQVS